MEKKFALCTTKKINIVTLVLSEKKNSERNKKPYPPLKLNGRSLKFPFVVLLYTFLMFIIYIQPRWLRG